jgi:predicted metal-binding protein
VPGRQDEATIREPGDLPSAVSTRQTRVGVYLWMIQKTISLLVLARADDRSARTLRGYFYKIGSRPRMGGTMAPMIYVCTTCRQQGKQESEPDSEPRPGALLAAATEQAAAGTEVVVRRLRCLANCSRGPSAAMRANGSWTYLFGGLDVANADALVEGARLLAGAADGILPWRGRPDILKRGLIARVPPLDFEEADL